MSFVKTFGVGWADLLQSFQRHELWLFLSWQDIRQRYRRSVLGPFWMTLSTGILVGTLGFLWSALFNQPIAEYLPFFAIGHVVWTFLSGALTEACVGFTQFESIIKQVRIPFGAMLLRVVVRHLIVLAHNFLIVVVVLLFGSKGLSWNIFLLIPGIALCSVFCFFAAGPIAVFCTRFRDMPLIVGNVLMILYYVTPVLWQPQSLKNNRWVYDYNPFFHLIEVVRAPILGSAASLNSYIWCFGAILVSALLYFFAMSKFRDRIAYWL
jgi:lipopolysaccharide transport system permease protein